MAAPARRYDSVEHLRAFRARGVFPAIHEPIFQLIADASRESRFLDLGCSIGLLGERLRRTGLVDFVLGVEADPAPIGAGVRHGLLGTVAELRVEAGTLPLLAGLIRRYRVGAVVARRCLPEILGDDAGLDRPFADCLADAGVRELFLEGRVVSPRSTHRLRSIDHEIAAVAGRFSVALRRGACCLLRPHQNSPL